MTNHPWASTKDLDLIKFMNLDQPNRHVNRLEFAVVVKEWSESILAANYDDWCRRRRTIGSALANHEADT
jgi:hypothetical protein